MVHNITPLYLSSLIPQSVSSISRYNLKNFNDLQTIDAMLEQTIFICPFYHLV